MFVEKVMITGHRNLPLDNINKITELIKDKLIELSNDNSELVLVSGMALGTDTIAVQLAIELNIKFIAVIPFKSQSKCWNIKQRSIYSQLINKADKVINVSKSKRGYTNTELYLERNKKMVDMSDYCIAVHNGNIRTGTGNAVKYAKNKGIKIYLINPNEV